MLIETTYKPPTNHHGSRIVVRAHTLKGPARHVVPYRYELAANQNHHDAAQTVFSRVTNRERYSTPYLARPTESGYVFIFDHSYPET